LAVAAAVAPVKVEVLSMPVAVALVNTYLCQVCI
jgi:hypothetical protein